MTDFFKIETPYNSEDYKMMKNVVNKGIDSHLEAFTKSKFERGADKFVWNIHNSELPLLYRRLQDLFNETGNFDYEDLLNDIRNVADAEKAAISGDEFGGEDLEEMVDPYDPMDANQTMNGFPAGNSDLNADGIDTAPAYKPATATPNQDIENYIDDDTIGQMLAKENSSDSLAIAHGENLKPNTNENDSDSLANAHGMNAKPETIDEITDTERYERVVFLDGSEADEAMDILNNDGRDAALEYLKQWHYPGQGMGSDEIGNGTQDKTYEKDGYIMSWNPYLPYIGLVYDTEHDTIDEDSLAMRHRTDQRQKDIPLGQHAPHSQVALDEESDSISLPDNKASMNGKYRTKESIKNAIYNALRAENVEGRYNDENWDGVKRLKDALSKHGIDYSLRGAAYKGQGDVENSNLPTRKIYIFDIEVRDKEGKVISLPLQVTCAFVGKTGTMADSNYELTYYLMA